MRRVDSRSWAPRAGPLADHALEYLVNRRDVWGQYLEPERRYRNQHGEMVKQFTAPAKRSRGNVTLQRRDVERHFRGDIVLGLHTTSTADTSRWLGFDFDNHGGGAESFRQNLQLVARVVKTLSALNIVALVEDAGGNGSFHAWALFDAPARTLDVFTMGQTVLTEARRGATAEIADLPVELYPKQAQLGGQYGNWLRLPGRHHTRDHWSRIRVDHRWYCGAAAADAWLAGPRNAVSLIPQAPAIEAPRVHGHTRATGRGAEDSRIDAYRCALPTGLVAKSGRADVAFSFALWLVHDAQATDARALEELKLWNQANAVPLAESKLSDTLANAHRYCARRHGGGHAA